MRRSFGRADRRARRPLALALTLVVAVAFVGCGPERDRDDAALAGLLVLQATADRAATLTIEVADDDEVTPHGLALPGPATTWIAAGRAGVLVATLADGSLHLSTPVDPSPDVDDRGPEWRPIDAADLTGEPPAGPFWFPVWDPEGGRFATLAGDLREPNEVGLVLIDPSTSAAFTIPLGRDVLAAPPAWIGADEVAVVVGTAAVPRARIVDTTTGEVRDGPEGDRFLAAAADGRTIATTGAAAGTAEAVDVRETASWLAWSGTAVGSVERTDDTASLAWFGLDRDGARLALAWVTDDGSLRVDVHARADGWARVASRTLDDGATGAVVGWLR